MKTTCPVKPSISNTRLPSIRHHSGMHALLPVEQLITKTELQRELNEVRASRIMWRLIAGMGWAFFLTLVYHLTKRVV